MFIITCSTSSILPLLLMRKVNFGAKSFSLGDSSHRCQCQLAINFTPNPLSKHTIPYFYTIFLPKLCKANYFLLHSTTIQFKTEKTIAIDTASLYEDKWFKGSSSSNPVGSFYLQLKISQDVINLHLSGLIHLFISTNVKKFTKSLSGGCQGWF